MYVYASNITVYIFFYFDYQCFAYIKLLYFEDRNQIRSLQEYRENYFAI